MNIQEAKQPSLDKEKVEGRSSRINLGEDFDKFSNDSKAWVYTADKPFDSKDLIKIEEICNTFLSQWESHGKKVMGNVQIVDNQFIAIFADPLNDTMCGRAQDASVRLIKELEEVTGVNMLNRMLIAIEIENKIKVYHLNDLKRLIDEGLIPDSTFLYNNLISTKAEFLLNWRIPINISWLS